MRFPSPKGPRASVRLSVRSRLEQIPATGALLDAAVAALSATLLPDRLIAENLDVIGPAASLLVLLALQVGFVVSVAPYGLDAGTHRFLVGHAYSEQGLRWIDLLGPMSASEYVGAIGDDRIAVVWGTSYLQTAGLYAYSYMAFMLGVALTLGAVGGTGKREPEEAAG